MARTVNPDSVTTPSLDEGGRPKRSLSLRRYRVIVWVAFASLYVIIVTGSLVRLTGSGLGCIDWPACNEERFVDVSTPHAAIEQLNRLFTGVVAASVVAAVLAAFFVRPRQRRLVRLALWLVVGVLAQVMLGGIVVLTGLHPLSNMGHFLLSIALMYGAYLLVDAVSTDGQREQPPRWSLRPTRAVRPLQGGSLLAISRVIVVLTLAAIVTGTVVTGTGPHAGDESAPRFDYLITSVVRVHGTAVWLAVLASLWLGWQLWRRGADQRVQRAFEWFLFLAILQGGLGYLQYFTGVPMPLVALHVALSVVVWLAALRLTTIVRRYVSCDTMA
ncbi:MAG: heme A synthase [Actinobacteria bacterium]|nr:heme A synthase [Actinomycetota bacterium]